MLNVTLSLVKTIQRLYNDPDFTNYVAETIKSDLDDVKGVEECEAQPPSEDFAFYAKTLPSTFIYSGAPQDGKAYPHHHPKFKIDEKSMLVAEKPWVQLC